MASSTKKKKDADAPAEEPASSLIPGLEEPASAATKSYTVLARRYRSRTFDEVVGQESISRTLQNAIANGRTAHAYLFCGTRGVGKTSMARIFARALNAHGQVQAREIGDAIMRGEDIDVVEIDGASNRGIDDARDLIAGAGIAPARSAYKIYIIDEVHMLTQPAFNALLKTMEEPPSHVKFILCTTEPHKVPATIQSRCQRFDFRNISAQRIAGHLAEVLAKEGIEADEAVVLQVARLANGSMRDGLSLLDRLVAASDGALTQEVARDVLGLPDDEALDAIVRAIAHGDAAAAITAGGALLERGFSADHALECLAARLRDVMVIGACGPQTDMVELPSEAKQQLAEVARSMQGADLVHAIALADAASRTCRSSSIPRVVFDALLARLALAERFEATGAAPPKK